MTQRNFTDFVDEEEQEFNSVKLSSIVNIPFTIKKVRKEKLGQFDGIIIEITNELEADGKTTTEFYTTSSVLVKKLGKDEVITALDSGDTIGPVKVISVKAKSSGRNYLDIVAVQK